MADDFARLREQVRRLESLHGMNLRAAPAAGQAILRRVQSTVESGRAPGGDAWRKRKDGGEPLQNAASAIRLRVIGDVVSLETDGHHARHNYGRVRGGVRRQILPTSKQVGLVADVLTDVVAAEFRKTMAGGR